MLAYDINELIQLEGDNLVYRNLDELVPVFRKYYPNIGIPFASDRLAIPGLFYVGNKEIVTEFSNAIVALFHEFQGFHDMNFLAAFGERTGKILPLPSLPKTYLEQGYTMVSLEGEAAKDPQFFTSHEEEFNGLFDPLPYGLFLDGPSAAHARYKQPERLNGSVFDPEKFSYIWKRDVQGRRLLYIRIGDQEWPLINLHVHSKDLDKFASYE